MWLAWIHGGGKKVYANAERLQVERDSTLP